MRNISIVVTTKIHANVDKDIYLDSEEQFVGHGKSHVEIKPKTFEHSSSEFCLTMFDH